jgi:histidyl-tRNA synthetase
MTDKAKPNRPKARVAKGFRDIDADEIRGTRAMLATIQRVYESYGFEPVEQPFIEYTDALGKFLPDQDRPNAGVFSFQDEDEQWLSLRYDLTAPLARFVAENTQGQLPSPYRSYRQGWVFRNEKPGPGRFRQFMQFDADTVGSSSPAADAEVCMMAADTMEKLGIAVGKSVVKINHRKVLDGLMEVAGAISIEQKLRALRAIDKLDRLGELAVVELLRDGRTDESGDKTLGAGLSEDGALTILRFLNPHYQNELEDGEFAWVPVSRATENIDDNWQQAVNGGPLHYYDNVVVLDNWELLLSSSSTAKEGISELRQMNNFAREAGYGSRRFRISPEIVRGLEYYTGPVFECELLQTVYDESGRPVRFGSVGGGGRYDDLVARFTGQQVPATGFSIGVSRLYAALKLVGKATENKTLAPVVVTVMDKDRQGDYWKFVQQLRTAGIRAEMYVGTSNMGKQMKYADKRGAPLVVIQGGDEKASGQVQIKDLRLGSELAANIASREEYASQRLAQVTVPEAELVAQVKKMLGQ